MGKFSPFAIRVEVDTPVILTNLLHLDGLVGRVVCDAGGSLEDVPLRRTAGVWHGSAAMLETTRAGAAVVASQKSKAVRETPAMDGVFDILPKKGRKIDAMSPYRNRLDSVPMWQGVKAVWFVGDGDGERVAEMVDGLPGIGGRVPVGYGRKTAVDLVELGSRDHAGIALADGLPARMVPLANWNAWGLSRHPLAVVTMARSVPPYWTGDVDKCIGPAQEMLIGMRHEIMGMIGA